ncbi:2-aminoethylphosphonate ABC transporter substrate-binding protein [Gordonia sp. PDNC005]|uniref:2-aminoethylphosphonate ABC transporter substrate-binding protein n=1 Tax=unclassified Gordonia (in: high G+C Gram-positive bacteria) TaxID=2657482 RepID=UPI00196642E4|nr:2-aminoethylphosphonate ABC transporter substrate-binding protein [Gordonia sp. PDNC005]QRY64114.1 2-aminoethylphosphonate ABC transporter substrate-binding protein [Gordonia sp. PDNC005]
MKRYLKASTIAVATLSLASVAACGGTGGSSDDPNTVTLYSADGLADWYTPQFKAFEAKTGIKVNYVEGGSGEVVSRADKEQSNPQMDVLVTLPPFIQQADKKGVIGETRPAGEDKLPATAKAANGHYVSLANNYFTMIRGTAVDPKPESWNDLLDPRFKQRLQYSTPGQAGDGTALLLLVQHVFGEQQGLDFLAKLQANNVGPSASTGKLGPKVSTGELSVANSDVQMALAAIANDKMAYETFAPTGPDGKRTTVALPYFMGKAAKAPHADNAQKLIDFLMSVDAQKSLATDAFGISARTDVNATGPNVDAITRALAGVDVWSPDWTDVNNRFDALVDAYNKATGQ